MRAGDDLGRPDRRRDRPLASPPSTPSPPPDVDRIIEFSRPTSSNQVRMQLSIRPSGHALPAVCRRRRVGRVCATEVAGTDAGDPNRSAGQDPPDLLRPADLGRKGLQTMAPPGPAHRAPARSPAEPPSGSRVRSEELKRLLAGGPAGNLFHGGLGGNSPSSRKSKSKGSKSNGTPSPEAGQAGKRAGRRVKVEA